MKVEPTGVAVLAAVSAQDLTKLGMVINHQRFRRLADGGVVLARLIHVLLTWMLSGGHRVGLYQDIVRLDIMSEMGDSPRAFGWRWDNELQMSWCWSSPGGGRLDAIEDDEDGVLLMVESDAPQSWWRGERVMPWIRSFMPRVGVPAPLSSPGV